MISNFINKLIEKYEILKEKYGSQKVGMCLMALFMAVVVFTAAGCTGSVSQDVSENVTNSQPGEEAQLPPPADGDMKMAEDIMNIPGQTPDNKPNTESIEVIANQNDKMVSMSVEDSGRANPFVPFGENIGGDNSQKLVDLQKQKLKYDLIDPPDDAVADPDAEKVLTTKISGIMYDKQSPSAIINIESSDYLVRSGDVVNGYKVLSISPTSVTVQLGANIYRAGVGELLATDGIQYNAISNLNKKFGGGKK